MKNQNKKAEFIPCDPTPGDKVGFIAHANYYEGIVSWRSGDDLSIRVVDPFSGLMHDASNHSVKCVTSIIEPVIRRSTI